MTAIDPAALEALTTALRNGTDIETACHYAGLSANQVLRQLEQGKVETERIAAGHAADPTASDALALWDELKKARADAIVRNVTYVQRAAADGAWQAAAWWLERTVPDQYGKKTAARTKPVEGGNPKAIEEN